MEILLDNRYDKESLLDSSVRSPPSKSKKRFWKGCAVVIITFLLCNAVALMFKVQLYTIHWDDTENKSQSSTIPELTGAVDLKSKLVPVHLRPIRKLASNSMHNLELLQGSYFDENLNATVLPKPFLSGLETTCPLPTESELIALRKDEKYFIEAGWDPVKKQHVMEGGSHYDERYFRTILLAKARQKLQVKLFKAFTHFAEQKEFPYWIAHGSLLGWYWGKRIMPWDDDIDIQMEKDTLRWIDCTFERSENGFIPVSQNVILDINPHFILNGTLKQNVIDARVIDTKTGLYIDITTLSTGPWDDPQILKDHNKPSQNLMDGIWWGCKSPHFYRENYIYPLVHTEFEGMKTWRPNNFVACLTSEYQTKSLTMENMWGRYQWNGSHNSDSDKVGREGSWITRF